jgi:hypothetical protein
MTKREKFILNILREGTIKWEERALCYRKHGRKIKEGELKKGGDKLKWYWKCAKCAMESREATDFEVDHIDEVGSFNGDWTIYINRLFCNQNNLQLLCVPCHKKKTATKNAAVKFKRKSEYDDLL